MWVIKLGGSLLSSESLKEWLSVIVKHGAGKLVIVPGGGIFADKVRDEQQKWKFDDKDFLKTVSEPHSEFYPWFP